MELLVVHATSSVDELTLILKCYQAGTNDLNKPSVSPQSLIGKLKEHVNDIKSFSNISKIFLCKVPPRSDRHRVNSKINHFNNLLVDELSNADNIIIVETIPLEARLFYADNLHLTMKDSGKCLV